MCLGECSVEQKNECVDGGINRQCTPSQPAEKDDDWYCLDDDCDGRVDEDVMVRTIECGAGACRVQGLEICFMAQWFERCTPLEPAEDVTVTGRTTIATTSSMRIVERMVVSPCWTWGLMMRMPKVDAEIPIPIWTRLMRRCRVAVRPTVN